MTNRRIYETVGVRYEDASKVADIVKSVHAMLLEHPDIAQTVPDCTQSYGTVVARLFLYTFTKTTNWVEYHAIKEDVLLKVLGIVAEHGAEIAFPTQTMLHHAPIEPLISEGACCSTLNSVF